MSILALVVILVFLGIVAYLVRTSGKITGTFKWIIQAVLITVAVLLVLYAFGIWDAVRSMKVPHL